MSLRRAAIGLAFLGFLALVSFAPAQQTKKDDATPEDKQVVDSKASQRPAASTVNFRKELNLPLDSLGTLGSRIETATRKPDPVALAHLANELNVAEKVSGKTASVTSKAVLQEAAELAKVRKQEAEMKALLQVTNQMMFQENDLALQRKDLALAQEQIKADKAAFDSKQEPTSAPRKVIVNNYTTQILDVYVNGYLKTTVQPGSTQVITVEHRWNPTVLKAYGNEDTNVWGPRYVWGKFDKYTWNIN
jgi:hypothetical protein